MSSAATRGEGKAEELGGKIQKLIGKVIGSEKLQAQGRAHEVHGKATQEAAKAAERTKGGVEEAVGATKNRVGAAVGSERLQAGGKAQELQGEARQEANRRD